jgi:hypothetical protein
VYTCLVLSTMPVAEGLLCWNSEGFNVSQKETTRASSAILRESVLGALRQA